MAEEPELITKPIKFVTTYKHSREDFEEIQNAKLQEIVNLKNKGISDETIAGKVGMTPGQVKFVFDRFLSSSIKDLSLQKNLVAMQSSTYRKRLAEAEEQYEKAKQIAENSEGRGNSQIAVAAWHKIVVETADSYTNYLSKIGAISADTYKQFQLEDEIKKEKSPLEILIEANRKKLMEEIEKAKEITDGQDKSV